MGRHWRKNNYFVISQTNISGERRSSSFKSSNLLKYAIQELFSHDGALSLKVLFALYLTVLHNRQPEISCGFNEGNQMLSFTAATVAQHLVILLGECEPVAVHVHEFWMYSEWQRQKKTATRSHDLFSWHLKGSETAAQPHPLINVATGSSEMSVLSGSSSQCTKKQNTM